MYLCDLSFWGRIRDIVDGPRATYPPLRALDSGPCKTHPSLGTSVLFPRALLCLSFGGNVPWVFPRNVSRVCCWEIYLSTSLLSIQSSNVEVPHSVSLALCCLRSWQSLRKPFRPPLTLNSHTKKAEFIWVLPELLYYRRC